MQVSMIELTDLEVCYGPVKAVRGVTMTVRPGSITSLVGANGAGKSTILKAITGLVPISGGSARVSGTDIAGRKASEIVRLGVALSPEGRRILPHLTVLENLRLGAFTRRDAAAVKKDLERVYSFFPVLAERPNELGGALSGGQQQMLAIGRALMAHPSILLLDEPSLGLAPIIVQGIARIVRQLASEGVTILLVEQNARMALSLASYAYVLETGKIVLEGPGKELLHNDYVIKSYLGG